jgi:hypothetical protein
MNPIDTTRRYPRTLSDAFPDSRASCTEGWQRPNADRPVMWACAVGVVAVIYFIFFGVPA